LRLCEKNFFKKNFLFLAKAQRTPRKKMHENDIAREIVDAAYKVHTALGPGLLESV